MISFLRNCLLHHIELNREYSCRQTNRSTLLKLHRHYKNIFFSFSNLYFFCINKQFDERIHPFYMYNFWEYFYQNSFQSQTIFCQTKFFFLCKIDFKKPNKYTFSCIINYWHVFDIIMITMKRRSQYDCFQLNWKKKKEEEIWTNLLFFGYC